MSFIAFELDALNRAPAVARASGVAEEIVIAGLVRLWAWCFREKVDRATTLQIRGLFGFDCCEALAAFGFLESADEAWRVRGAERYLRVSAGRSKGGKAASGNLKRGSEMPKPGRDVSPGSVPAGAGSQPGVSPGFAPALTPSTDHRAPTSSPSETTGAPPPREPSFWAWAQDERHRALGLVRERPKHPASISAWLSRAMAEVGGDIERLRAGWQAYMRDPHWQPKGAPWDGWVSQWERFVPAAAPPARPACVACGKPAATGWPELGAPTCHPCAGLAMQWADERGLVVYEAAGQWAAERRAVA